MWIDFIDFKNWRDLIPFGSAMLGAMVGGGITYTTAKFKDNKEARIKRLEALFELETTLLSLIHKLADLEFEVAGYHAFNTIEVTYIDESKEHLEKKAEMFRIGKLIKELKRELSNSRPILLANAVHVSREVYLMVHEKYEEIAELYVTFHEKVSNDELGMKPYYKKDTVDILKNIYEKTIFLYISLLDLEAEHAPNYSKQIVKK
ncbi:hypothetical protein [Bacillus cereus]|uniref:Uncharacterized protein n=1 Tax=Bacillus cereus HuA4-10 TaxID=1053206 RepID=J8DDV1_BACCE|nr:hypothetical protein [Bacillus cereus]EJQ74344.1 hypothetical protein IGC_04895 [Bacillus cereus HuA4-10]